MLLIIVIQCDMFFFQCRHSRHFKNVDMLGDFIVLRGPMGSIVDKLAGYY